MQTASANYLFNWSKTYLLLTYIFTVVCLVLCFFTWWLWNYTKLVWWWSFSNCKCSCCIMDGDTGLVIKKELHKHRRKDTHHLRIPFEYVALTVILILLNHNVILIFGCYFETYLSCVAIIKISSSVILLYYSLDNWNANWAVKEWSQLHVSSFGRRTGTEHANRVGPVGGA